MGIVGIIANPASGKDIRRLVAHSSVFDNNEKVNILRRVLIGLDAVGVRRVYIMPDYYGLGSRATENLKLGLEVSFLPMPVRADERDSVEAARRLYELDVRSIITLGGDGTNRAVAKACGSIPLVPISTGTNNVVPEMVEGTIAGLAAGVVATGTVAVDEVSRRAKRLEIYAGDDLVDIALVDVTLTRQLFIATRALWDPNEITEIVLARAEPGSIGMAAIGACIHPLDACDDLGLHLRLGDGPTHVLAPVAPGLVASVGIRYTHLMVLGAEVVLEQQAGTLALDGERHLEVFPGQRFAVRLTRNGPRFVDVQACLAEAARQGAFRTTTVAEAHNGNRS